jgi:hypothetical protein
VETRTPYALRLAIALDVRQLRPVLVAADQGLCRIASITGGSPVTQPGPVLA